MIERSSQDAIEATIRWPFGNLFDRTRSAWARIADALAIYAEVWGEVTIYEELSRLSDAELERRGIPRADLYRHVFETSHKQ
jgi:hypothetical protein